MAGGSGGVERALYATTFEGGPALASVDYHPGVFAVPGTANLIARRTLDISIALIALIIFAVPGLLLALLVKYTSDGPVLFTQTRIGRSGNPFTVLKFRTMEHGTHDALLADADRLQAYRDNDFKLASDDARITTVGRILRKTSLDELPQLLNVLRGDMSIVGIRPLLNDEVALRPEYDQMLYRMMRPGMTGLWQVEGRSSITQSDRIALDRRYVENWSVAHDLWIIVRTPLAVLRTGDTQ